MTYVDTSDISAQMFITVLLFLLIIAPLISLGVLRFFKLKRNQDLFLLAAALLYTCYFSSLHLSLKPKLYF